MKKEIADIWVEALRSGKYYQTDSQLRADNSFCCLGVLCDIHGIEFDQDFIDETYLDEIHGLPHEVMKWSGVGQAEGKFYEAAINPETVDFVKRVIPNLNMYTSLSVLNDRGASFPEIANFIEKNWEIL
jgi:hypothetical protein